MGTAEGYEGALGAGAVAGEDVAVLAAALGDALGAGFESSAAAACSRAEMVGNKSM